MDRAEKPILFNTEMVRAVLEGRKTQTRRVVKNVPSNAHFCDINYKGNAVFTFDEIDYFEVKCPYGDVGDYLWVRETYKLEDQFNGYMPSDVPEGENVFYCATDDVGVGWGGVRPSIFMMRWMSRILLKIANVRIERLNEISEEDCKAEGIIYPSFQHVGGQSLPYFKPKFRRLWDSINGKREGCSWDENPWVWVVEFERVENHIPEVGQKVDYYWECACDVHFVHPNTTKRCPKCEVYEEDSPEAEAELAACKKNHFVEPNKMDGKEGV